MTNGNDSISPTDYKREKGDYNTIETFYLRIGLTKREYFAALAMQGLLSLPWDSELPSLELHRTIAALSVEHAEQLIKALNK